MARSYKERRAQEPAAIDLDAELAAVAAMSIDQLRAYWL